MMKMKLYFILLASMLALTPMVAQEIVSSTPEPVKLSVAEKVAQWRDEVCLDTIDQENLPKKVTFGLLLNGNLSNFMITRSGGKPMSSYLRLGGEFGIFSDFKITSHFHIQPQLLFTAERNHFAWGHEDDGLWAFGMDIPVYFLGNYGNMRQGYLQFGGGIYTHFQFASNVGDRVQKKETYTPSKTEIDRGEIEKSYAELLKLHSNHFGIGLMLGYEFRFGLQINASYKISLSDICSFYVNNKTKKTDDTKVDPSDPEYVQTVSLVDAAIYPQKFAIGVGYRFR